MNKLCLIIQGPSNNVAIIKEKYKNINIPLIFSTWEGEENKYNENDIDLLDPVDYESMVHLISNSKGIITDSGGLQEETVCANKRVLVCRNTTEWPETINCGLGRLINSNIKENITFFDDDFIDLIDNPYGSNICDKIVKVLKY